MKPEDSLPLAVERDNWTRHWEEYADSAEKNPAQDYRRRIVLSMLDLSADSRGVRLLDIGSGQGDLAAWIQQRCPDAQILGLELSESGIAISQAKVPAGTFVQRDLLESHEVPKEFQGWATHAVCSEVIEHVDNPAALLRNARDYMAPGCKLIVTAPGGPMSMFDRHIGHRKHFRAAEITGLLQEAGYIPQRASGAGFPFFNLYRCVVILRGKKLIEDVRTRDNESASSIASLVMKIFQLLFRFNSDFSSWGWQQVAEARVPSRPGDSSGDR